MWLLYCCTQRQCVCMCFCVWACIFSPTSHCCSHTFCKHSTFNHQLFFFLGRVDLNTQTFTSSSPVTEASITMPPVIAPLTIPPHWPVAPSINSFSPVKRPMRTEDRGHRWTPDCWSDLRPYCCSVHSSNLTNISLQDHPALIRLVYEYHENYWMHTTHLHIYTHTSKKLRVTRGIEKKDSNFTKAGV